MTGDKRDKKNMHFHKLYSDENGESHWATIGVTLTEKTFAAPAKSIEVSAAEPFSTTLFLRLKAGWDEPIHTTPVVQKLICLRGAVRVTASDGDAREIGAGDVWHMEDTHGKGYHTAVISTEDFEAVMVQYT